ncbi:MAG: iron ABC transporter substrate-binding protein [Candidatus Promineifilaceae bacterium]|nr:iron ABC transporter substrate-binding protein [Candidatus Promineifilaceae bacterium]
MTQLRRTVWLLLLSMVLALAACGGTDTTEGEIEQTDDPGELVVYSGRSESLVQPIIDQFIEATGIDVQVKYGGTAELAATLLEEGDASPADVFYAQDPGGLGAVEEAGLLAPLPAGLLERVPARFASADSLWVGISGRARVVVHNTDQVTTEELPAELTGFTDPVWQGRIGWAPTNGSFQAMVTAMRALWGDDATRAWLEGIQSNDPVVYEGNTPIVAAVGAGEVEVGFVNHYYLYRFLEEEGQAFPARNYFLPGGGPGSLIMVSGAGILDSAANPDNAQRFLEFLLSPEAQEYFTTETFEYPVIEGVEPWADLPPLAELDQAAADINLTELADLQGTVQMLSEVGVLP